MSCIHQDHCPFTALTRHYIWPCVFFYHVVSIHKREHLSFFSFSLLAEESVSSTSHWAKTTVKQSHMRWNEHAGLVTAHNESDPEDLGPHIHHTIQFTLPLALRQTLIFRHLLEHFLGHWNFPFLDVLYSMRTQSSRGKESFQLFWGEDTGLSCSNMWLLRTTWLRYWYRAKVRLLLRS